MKKSLEEVSPIFDNDRDLEVEPTFEKEKEEVVEPVVEEEVSTEIEETPAEEVVEPVLEDEEQPEEEVVEEEVEPVVEEKTEVVEPEYDAPIQDMVKETETDDKNLFAPNNYTEYTEPTNDTTSIENNEVYSDKKAPEVGFTPEAEEKTEVVEPVLEEEDTLPRLDGIQTETPLNAQDRVIEPVLSYDERDIKGMYDLSKEIPGIDDNRLMM